MFIFDLLNMNKRQIWGRKKKFAIVLKKLFDLKVETWN